MATKHFTQTDRRRFPFRLALLAGVLALAACGSGTGSGSNIRDLAGAGAQIAATTQPTPLPTAPPPTETLDLAPQTITQPAQVIEATRIVEVTRQVVDVQQIEVTRIVEVVITPTPDIAGFQDSGIDESIQPCPIKFWKRGRCIATQAQIEQATNEVTR